MKLTFLGTAAAEGFPSVFCDCETCNNARRLGGKNIRSRSQAVVNDDLLIDFPVDTYMHSLSGKLDLLKIKNCIITHTHNDHFSPYDLRYNGTFTKLPTDYKGIKVYGNKHIAEEMSSIKDFTHGVVDYEVIELFKSVKIGNYTVTPLRAIHSAPDSYFYIISDGKSNLLYAHDTDYFPDDTWDYLEKNKLYFNMVSLDCTNGDVPENSYVGHMGTGVNVKVKERLYQIGAADDNTKFVLNHFSHNGVSVNYVDIEPIANKLGFTTAYDGMSVKF